MRNVIGSLLACLLLLTGIVSCQKEADNNSELQSIRQQNDSLRVLVIRLQDRTDSIVNVLEGSQQQQVQMQKRIDSLSKKLDTVIANIEKLNIQLTQVTSDLNTVRQQLAALTAQYNDLLLLIAELEMLSCTVNNGLIGYFPFSGNFLDSSGKRHDGQIFNEVFFVSDRNNNPNSAIEIRGGSNNRIVTTVPFDFQRPEQFSISFWFVDAGNTSGRIVSTENPEGNFRISSYQNGRYAFQMGGIYLYDTVQLNTWNHVVYTYSNKSIKLYKNGKLKVVATDTGSEGLNYGTPFTIGSKAASAYDSWNGKIDELRVYNRELSDKEVDRLFREF